MPLNSSVPAVRNKEIRLIIYLDEIIVISSSREFSAEETTIVIHILESLGFIVNKEISMLVPSQRTEFLGFVIDTLEMFVSLPEGKINKVESRPILCGEKSSAQLES